MSVLVPGALAPQFTLESLDGSSRSLASFRGRRVLLAFLRNARCAVCNLWVHQTAHRAPAWAEAGLDVVTVFESSASRLRAQFDARRPPFAVLADPDGAVHEAYGSRSDPERVAAVVQSGAGEHALARAAEAGFAAVQEEGANFFRLPAEVLVDAYGRVARVHIAEAVVDHLSPDEIDAFARAR
ncbi:MAG: redoxin domain-containing protein [Sandaracinus sp.]